MSLTRSNEGWTQLPGIVLEKIGLSDRRRRAEAVNALVKQGALETRTAGIGKALEYPVCCPSPDGSAQRRRRTPMMSEERRLLVYPDGRLVLHTENDGAAFLRRGAEATEQAIAREELRRYPRLFGELER